MKKELIIIAVAAMLVAGCSRPPSVTASTPADQPDRSAGLRGPEGNTGAMGDRLVDGTVGQWTSYRDYAFKYNDARIDRAESAKSAGIAAYMQDNPSLQLGLDGSMDPQGSDPRDQTLRDRRVEAVRANLVAAGVPASRIKVGAYGDPSTRRDRRVEVLFATAK